MMTQLIQLMSECYCQWNAVQC